MFVIFLCDELLHRHLLFGMTHREVLHCLMLLSANTLVTTNNAVINIPRPKKYFRQFGQNIFLSVIVHFWQVSQNILDCIICVFSSIPPYLLTYLGVNTRMTIFNVFSCFSKVEVSATWVTKIVSMNSDLPDYTLYFCGYFTP